jgi:hypothetical protein
VKYDTAWLLHNKILRAITEREDAYVLRGKIQMDDAYLGGERPGDKVGRGSDNKIHIVAPISLNEVGHPIHAKITLVAGISSEAVGAWARENLAPSCTVLSDGLACFRSVTTAGCSREAIVTGGKHPNELTQFRWINTLLGNLRTSLSGTFHAFNFHKYAKRYIGGYCFSFNRCFSMAVMTERIANAVCCCMHCTERDLRVAETNG